MDEVLPEIQWLSSPEDQWNLTNLTPKELTVIYPDRSWDSLRRRRTKINQLINQGKLAMPPKNPEYDGNPEAERERANARRKRVAPKTGETALRFFLTEQQIQELHDQLDKVIDTVQGHPGENYELYRTLIYEQGFTTGAQEDKEGRKQSLHSIEVRKKQPEGKMLEEPLWLPVTRIEGVRIPKKEAKTLPELGGKMIGFGDAQIPYVDWYAVSVMLQIARDAKPTHIVAGGDIVDLSEWGRYQQRPEFAGATKPSMRMARRLFEYLRRQHRSAEILYPEANHEIRIPNYLLNNAKAAFNVPQAHDPEGWPVMSVPHMMSLDLLDVKYIDGFPNNTIWLNDELQVKHRAKGRGPVAVVNNEYFNVIYFDNHRIESSYKTYPVKDGAKQYGAFGVGALCLLDKVPGANSGAGLRGEIIGKFENNWQQGIVEADFDPSGTVNNVNNGIRIDTLNGYRTIYNGKLYLPDLEIIKALIGDDPEAQALMLRIDPRLKEIYSYD